MGEKILIIGMGGREHSLGWKLAQSDGVDEVLYAPGNGGTFSEIKSRNVLIDGTQIENFGKIVQLIDRENIGLVVVGPEAPLDRGIVDYLNLFGIDNVFGPTKSASRLESDKFYSFDIMNKLGIPQASGVKCHTLDESINAIKYFNGNVVIKARGPSNGKGVIVCDTKEGALELIVRHNARYGKEALISERLYGEEFSIFGISDGEKVMPFDVSFQDHKRLLDEDHGPNTGGMGAYGPAPIAHSDVIKYVSDEIMNPVVEKMNEEGNMFRGFLYAGMIMTYEGPKVLEFNVRMGDPECQTAMMLINDLYAPISLSLEMRLGVKDISFKPGYSCCVVLASRGYPYGYSGDLVISNLDEAEKMTDIKVFHSGTRFDDGKIFTSGGRVLGVTSYSYDGIFDAKVKVYEAVSKIKVPGGFHYRTDIGDKALW